MTFWQMVHWFLYIYSAIGAVVGCAATYKNWNLFRSGSPIVRVARAIAHTIIIGALWWLLGPVALGRNGWR